VNLQAKRNITLSLPIELIQQLKILAAQRDTSISALLTEQAQLIVDAPDERAQATARLIELMENAQSYGVVGTSKWSREDAYDHLKP